MKKDNKGMLMENRTKFLRNGKREREIDDSTFTTWKLELEKELPSFWESMTKL